MTLENVQDIYPLSPMQTGILFHAIEASEPGLYVLQLRVTLEGPLRFEVLRDAWGEVVQRHEALRAAFVWEGLEEPLQVIHEQVETPWARVDARALLGEHGPDAVDAWLAEDRRHGFDLKQAPLMRVAVLDFGDGTCRLVWTLHHLLADAWSMAVVLRELHAAYHARIAGRPLALEPAPAFRDFVAWLKARDPESSKETWKRHLEGFTQPSRLGFPPPEAPVEAGERSVEERLLPVAAEASLNRLARDRRVTPTALYYTAWALTLSRYAASDEVVFGSVFSGRGHGLAGAERAVGLHINTVPVRVRLGASDTVAALIDRVHGDLLALRRQEHTPLGRIQAWSGVAGGTPLFDSMLVVENHPPLGCDHGEVRFRDFDPMDQSNFLLSAFVIPGERLKLLVLFDPALLDAAAVRRLLDQFATALEALPAMLERPPLAVPALPEEERLALEGLARGPEISASWPANILESIAACMRENPDRAALVFGQDTLSYGELAARAAQCARQLEALGLGRGDRVAILLERGCEVVVAMLGVLRSGACYVPLDAGYPVPRIQAVLEDCAPGAVITTDALAGTFSLEQPVVRLSSSVDTADAADFDAGAAGPDDVAYVMYTSGSTGRPKGVAVRHDNLGYSTGVRQIRYGAPPEVFLLLSSFAFDSSVAGLYWTLASGGTLVISEPGLEQAVDRLAGCIESHAVTHTLCLPSLYEVVLEFAPAERLASLRTVIVAGEAVPAGLVGRHRSRLGGVGLFNEYGPTEATVWCTVADLTDASPQTVPPIGRPIPGAEVRLLVDGQRQAPLGAVGELWVGGPGVAAGYLGRARETAEAFVPLAGGDEPFYRTGDLGRYRSDGLIEFLGRRDEQVKIRGHRIETGEIEALLRGHPEVIDACVLAVPAGGAGEPGSSGRLVLAAFVTGAAAGAGSGEALRGYCRERLPGHMVPVGVTVLEAFPQLPNGKVDRRALALYAPRPGSDHGGDGGPRDDFEAAVASLWEEVLGVDRVGIHDDFFALGGDSLASIRIVALARARGYAIAPSEIFEFPTVAEQGRLRRSRATAEAEGDGPSTRGDEGSPPLTKGGAPFFMVHGGQRMLEALAAQFQGARPVHLLADHRDSGEVAPFATVESLARAYLEQVADLQDTPPTLLGGYSVGAPIAMEMARQLQARGCEPPLVFLLDPPDDAAYFRAAAGFAPAGPRPERSTRDPRQRGDASAAARRARKGEEYPRPLAILAGAACRSFGLSVPLPARRRYVPWVYDRALRRHALQAYAGPLLIFYGSDTVKDAAGRTLWERLGTAGVDTTRFEALHTEFVRNPAVVDEWTTRLAERLEAYENQRVDRASRPAPRGAGATLTPRR